MDIRELREELTDESIKEILAQFNVEPIDENEERIIFPTCCHNLEGGSPKLFYYKNTKLFHCYTECAASFDIFTLLQKMYALRGQEITLRQAVEICNLDSGSLKPEDRAYNCLDDIKYMQEINLFKEERVNIALSAGVDIVVELPFIFTVENADYFASEGIGTYTLEDTEVEIEGVGEVGLYTLLKRRQYGKIYIMLGLNEIWAGPEEVAENYKQLLTKIRELAPDALIFIQANLYVSASYAEDEPVFSNDNIRALNRNLSKLANGKDIFYIDVNPLFEDENGNLNDEHTGDGAHVYASLYQEWDEWLKTRGIVLKKPELVFEIEQR